MKQFDNTTIFQFLEWFFPPIISRAIAINGGMKKNKPVNFEPRERPITRDKSITYLVLRITYFEKETIGWIANLNER